MALGKLCACGAVIPAAGDCQSCNRAKWRADGAQRRERDKANGGSIYRRVEWGRVRLQVLRRDKFRCQYGAPGCLGKANQGAHVIPPSGVDDPLAYDPTNIVASCSPCNLLEQAERRRRLHAVDL